MTSRAPPSRSATSQTASERRFEAITGLAPARFARMQDGPNLARSLLWVAAVRVVLVTTGLGIAFWQLRQARLESSSDLSTWQYSVIGIAYGLALAGILALRQGWLLRVVAYVQMIADAGIVTAVVLMTGGAESVFAFTYVFVVLEASVVLLRVGAAIAMVLSTVLFAGVIALQMNGAFPSILPSLVSAHALYAFFVHTAGVGLVGVLASGLATKLRVAGRRLMEREDDLERLGELHMAILKALPAGLLTVNPNGKIRFGNAAAHTILRRGSEALVGLALADVLPAVAEVIEEGPRRARSPGPGTAMRARHEAPLVLPGGDTIRIGFSLAPLPMPEGLSTVVVFQDVTEIVELEEAVERAERLASVGKFAAGLAHEVRNPLASMCASIDVLEQTLEPPQSMRRLMANVVREAERLERLIQDFLALARPRRLTLVEVDLAVLVGSVLEMFENEPLMESVELRSRARPGIRATVDPDLIRQVIWNLVRNAAEAMRASEPADRLLTVEIRRGLSGPVVEVQDTGPGLSEKQARRAFDPFFSTKTEGSGLGLAISQSIMTAHGGQIEFFSRPGEGTRVVLRFRDGVPSVDVPFQDVTPVEPMLAPAGRAEGEGGSPSRASRAKHESTSSLPSRAEGEGGSPSRASRAKHESTSSPPARPPSAAAQEP